MSCWTKDELENMLFDVVDALNLSEATLEKHGPLGTAPAELVRIVLERKDLEIQALKSGCIILKNDAPPKPSKPDHKCTKLSKS